MVKTKGRRFQFAASMVQRREIMACKAACIFMNDFHLKCGDDYKPYLRDLRKAVYMVETEGTRFHFQASMVNRRGIMACKATCIWSNNFD